MPETKEVQMRFRMDEIVPEPNRTKLFFIIHQSTLDGSIDFNDPVYITNHQEDVDPYSNDQAYMHRTKIHNQISKHLYAVTDKCGIPVNRKEYYLIKLFNRTHSEMIKPGSVVYLPQTNQMVICSDDWNEDILLSHEYVFVIN
jgi:hypothetical protein